MQRKPGIWATKADRDCDCYPTPDVHVRECPHYMMGGLTPEEANKDRVIERFQYLLDIHGLVAFPKDGSHREYEWHVSPDVDGALVDRVVGMGGWWPEEPLPDTPRQMFGYPMLVDASERGTIHLLSVNTRQDAT